MKRTMPMAAEGQPPVARTGSAISPAYWGFGDDKKALEDPIHRIHAYPAKFPTLFTTKTLRYAKRKGPA